VTVSVADASVMEGDAGSAMISFAVSLSGPNEQVVTVRYATGDGTATAGQDFTATSGTLTFQPGETTKPIAVAIISDTTYEPDEIFTVTLSDPTGGVTLGRAQAMGVIRNDDAPTRCAPRPAVRTQSAIVGGKLQVTVSTASLSTQENNALTQLRFGELRNARVTFNGRSVASGQTVAVSPSAVTATFTVERVTPGEPTTVFFAAVDACGEWRTFVGGGAASGF